MFKIKFTLISIIIFVVLAGCSSKPPAGVFPDQVGNFRAANSISALSSEKDAEFIRSYNYNNSNNPLYDVTYYVYPYSSNEQAKAKFNERKSMELKGGFNFEVKQETDSRLAAVEPSYGYTQIIEVLGDNLVIISANFPADAAEFENNLPYEAFGVGKPSAQPLIELKHTDVLAFLDQSQQPNAKKYDHNSFVFSGMIDSFAKQKDGSPGIVFRKPGATNYTLNNAVGATFLSSEDRLQTFQKGQEIKFHCQVTNTAAGILLLNGCSLLQR